MALAAPRCGDANDAASGNQNRAFVALEMVAAVIVQGNALERCVRHQPRYCWRASALSARRPDGDAAGESMHFIRSEEDMRAAMCVVACLVASSPALAAQEVVMASPVTSDAAPSLEPMAAQTATVGEPIRLQFLVLNIDGGDQVQYTIQGPQGATVDAANGVLAWLPRRNDVGQHHVRVGATANGIELSPLVVPLTVTSADHPPVIQPLGDFSVEPGTVFRLQLRAYDPDGDPVRFTANIIQGNPIPGPDSTGLVVWQVPAGAQAPRKIRFTATDDRGYSSSTEAMVVVEANQQKPEFLPRGYNVTVTEGEKVELRFQVFDGNADPVTLAFQPPFVGPYLDPASYVFTWTPPFDFVGESQLERAQTFTIAATDAGGSGQTAILPITVTVVHGVNPVDAARERARYALAVCSLQRLSRRAGIAETTLAIQLADATSKRRKLQIVNIGAGLVTGILQLVNSSEVRRIGAGTGGLIVTALSAITATIPSNETLSKQLGSAYSARLAADQSLTRFTQRYPTPPAGRAVFEPAFQAELQSVMAADSRVTEVVTSAGVTLPQDPGANPCGAATR